MIWEVVLQFLVLLSLCESQFPTSLLQGSLIYSVGFFPLLLSICGLHYFQRVCCQSNLDLSILRLGFEVWVWNPGVFNFGFPDRDKELWPHLSNSWKEMKFSFNIIDGSGSYGCCLLTIHNDSSSLLRFYGCQRTKESQTKRIMLLMQQIEVLCSVYVETILTDSRPYSTVVCTDLHLEGMPAKLLLYSPYRESLVELSSTLILVKIQDSESSATTSHLIFSVNVMRNAFWSFIQEMIANNFVKKGHSRFYLLAYKTSERKAWLLSNSSLKLF